MWRTTAAFGALATSDMEPVLREVLTDSSREKEHQLVAYFVLRVLKEGSPLSSLSDILLGIVRDDTWLPGINTPALDAFIHCHTSQDKTSRLKTLLADIHIESISDPNNELLGTLLTQLYPQELPPSELWDYLSEKGNPDLIGRHCRFWNTGLIEKSSDENVAELLDNLNGRIPGLRPALESRHLSGLPLKLLARVWKHMGTNSRRCVFTTGSAWGHHGTGTQRPPGTGTNRSTTYAPGWSNAPRSKRKSSPRD